MSNKALLQELHQIIKKDYNIELQPKALAEVADMLVGYFDLLAKIYYRNQLKDKKYANESNPKSN